MSYYISTRVSADFDETIARVEDALKAEGFGVLTRIENEPEVAAIDPVASMQAIDNANLKNAAAEVRERLARVIDSLSD